MTPPKPNKKQPLEELVEDEGEGDETEYLENIHERYQEIQEEEAKLSPAERLARLRVSAAQWDDELEEK